MSVIEDAGSPPLRLAIVGGGFTGAVLAFHAIRASSRPLDVTIVEPAAELGRGTAYGTHDRSHRINVPSARMGLTANDPDEATRWFLTQGILPDAGSDDGHGQFYVPREAYGAFMADALRAMVAAAKHRVRFRHRRARAIAVTPDGIAAPWRVSCDDGAVVAADLVALCFGHAAPAAPCPIGPDVDQHPKFLPNPWQRNALSAIGADDSVLIVGTGLTMADVVMSLRAAGHAGSLTAVSRRGLLPLGHGAFASNLDLFPDAPPPRTALGLLSLLRRRARDFGPSVGWQPVVDSLRLVLADVWNGLPPHERHKVMRRLLPFWEIHRFRIAPQIDAALRQARDDGRLSIERAGLNGVAVIDGRFVATLRRPDGTMASHEADAVVMCTGPDRDIRRNPLIASLLTQGLAELDAVGLGLAVDRHSRLLDTAGSRRRGLTAFGPMTRGSFGEMTGAPDITRHIEQIIGDLLRETPSPLEDLS